MIGDRWGVTEAETARRYPCDDIISNPGLQAWRGITVAAAPDALWPWVAQIRLAPYSYDWIDNRGCRSPRQLRDLPPPVVGEPFTASGGHPVGQIQAVEQGIHLTGTIMGTVFSYVLVQSPDQEITRLLVKVVARQSLRPVAVVICLGDLVMVRKQLITIAHLAEHQPTIGSSH